MPRANRSVPVSAAVLAAAIASATTDAAGAQTTTSPSPRAAISASVPIGATDIGGVVTSASGPEAGVWVIAETTDLPTKLVKIVVTDDRGRYLLPDFAEATSD